MAGPCPRERCRRNCSASDGGAAGIDDDFAARGFQNLGAWILGRNMFGPVRGPWPDESWRGWWGENPVYHVPVFVLTNHARAPLVMEGGTTFHFVTEGIAAALAQAREAAQGKDVRLGGGVNVIQQYLRQRLIDEMHIAIAPVLLGAGERLVRRNKPSSPGLHLHPARMLTTGHSLGSHSAVITVMPAVTWHAFVLARCRPPGASGFARTMRIAGELLVAGPSKQPRSPT